jgi:hypothetical protein
MDEFWTEQQKQDIAFFNENLEEWVNDPLYNRKFVIISNKKVHGVCDSFETALNIAVSTYGATEGKYVIQQILPKNGTVNFLSPALALL